MTEIARQVAHLTHAREIAAEHVRWLRSNGERPGTAVVPVLRFVVEHPVTTWEDVVEVFARAWLEEGWHDDPESDAGGTAAASNGLRTSSSAPQAQPEKWALRPSVHILARQVLWNSGELPMEQCSRSLPVDPRTGMPLFSET
jgi:hypothetical protein